MKINFDKPGDKCNNDGLYGGLGSLSVPAYKEKAIDPQYQKDVIKEKVERYNDQLKKFIEKTNEDVSKEDGIEGKIGYLDEKINLINSEIAEVKDMIMENEDLFEQGFLEKIFTVGTDRVRDIEITDTIGNGTDIMTIYNFFRKSEEEVNFLNKMKDRLKHDIERQEQSKPDMKEAA